MYTITQNNTPLNLATFGEVLVELNRRETPFKLHAGAISVSKDDQPLGEAVRGYNHVGVALHQKQHPVDRLTALLQEEKAYMRRPNETHGFIESWLAPYEVSAQQWGALMSIGELAYGVIPGLDPLPGNGPLEFKGVNYTNAGYVAEAMFNDTFGYGTNGPLYDGRQTNDRHEVHVAYALLRGDAVPDTVLEHYRHLDRHAMGVGDVSWMFALIDRPFMQGRFRSGSRLTQLLHVTTQPGSRITEITEENIGYLCTLMAELKDDDGWLEFDNLLFDKGLWRAREVLPQVDLDKLGTPVNGFAKALRDALGQSRTKDSLDYLQERIDKGQMSKREAVEHRAQIRAQEITNTFGFANKVATAILNKDMAFLVDLLGHTGSETIKRVMEQRLGVFKLARGNAEQRMRAIFAAVGYHTEDEYLAARKTYEDGKMTAQAAVAGQKKKEDDLSKEQRAKEVAASTNFRYNGVVMDGSKLVEHLIANGYTNLAVKKVGAVPKYSLRNSATDCTVRVKKSDGTMDYAVILLEKIEMTKVDDDFAASLFTTKR